MFAAVHSAAAPAAQVIRVEHDVEGLQQAIFALFEESFFRDYFTQGMKLAAPETIAARVDALNLRTLSPGYYAQAMYLLDLGAAMETGVGYSAAELGRADVRGLQALARAKAAFEREHPFCGACGARQESRFAPSCHSCNATRGGIS